MKTEETMEERACKIFGHMPLPAMSTITFKMAIICERCGKEIRGVV